MTLQDLGPEALWRCYQRGYSSLVNNGAFFRQLVRPGLSHAFFQRALPLLQEYARSNRSDKDLLPGFRERLEANMLSPRDMIHLDYAICLGYLDLTTPERPGVDNGIMHWPGPASLNVGFVASDPPLKSKPAPIATAEEADIWQVLTELTNASEGSDGSQSFNDLPRRSALLSRLFGLSTDSDVNSSGVLTPDEEAEMDLDLALAELEEAALEDGDITEEELDNPGMSEDDPQFND
jgi:hypothetical protein